MFFYFDFTIWWKLVQLAGQEKNPQRRRKSRIYLLVKIPLRALGHAVCFFLDGILFPGLWFTPIKQPVFIIGHARSGTTLAHRLMGADGQFSLFKYYELLLPSLIEKKVVRLFSWLDRTLLGRRIEKRLQAWEEKTFGPLRHIHKMGLSIPEEDDLVLYSSCASGFWATRVPTMGDLDFFRIDERPAASRRRLMGFYRQCLRRQLYLNGGNAIHLSKNPTFCGRVESIIEAFPDARFVVLYRNPYETIPSLLKLLHTGWKIKTEQDRERALASSRASVQISIESYLHPIEVLARHPEVPRAEIDYRQLIAEPKATIEGVYRQLGLTLTDSYRQTLQKEQDKAKKHESEHRYSMEEFGLDGGEIRRRLAPLFDRFQWDAEPAAAQLRAAWDRFMTQLHEAREAIDDPALWPPPATPRNLAEGYRYVMGFLYGSIARSFGPTPEFPHFVRAIQPLNRSTIDNADAIYLTAPIDGNHSYTIVGKAGDSRHWRGEAPVREGRKAPHYVIFEAPSGYSGDSGSIKELKPGSRTNCSVLDCSKLQVNADGSFEILLAPERPEGYTGNYMRTRVTRTRTRSDGTTESREYVTQMVMLRELFCDWQHEDLLDLFIYRNDLLGRPMPAYTPEMAAKQMDDAGRFTRNQVRFWNEFYAITCEAYGDMNGDGQCLMPRNAFNRPNAASLATAGGMATNIYCGGIYELAPDEAMIVELNQPIEPNYIGFHLGNMWGESLDFANYQSSLNALQAHRDPDNVLRYVIAHQDPGVANWVDTTGHPEGYMAVRWAYSVRPTENLPWADSKKVKLAELMQHLPPGTAMITPEERRRQIAIRQEHVQRRYRQH